MKSKLLLAISFTILLGVLALAFNTAFGNQTITFLTKERITMGNTTWFIWKFDMWPYLKNIELSTTDLSILKFDMPTRQWNNSIDITNWLQVIGNNLAVILDYMIMIINLLLYPLKVGAYLLRNILAIMGINQDTTAQKNGLAWLVIFVRDILSNIAIPYI